jgi:DNA-binding NarL/FixJ family response regulator
VLSASCSEVEDAFSFGAVLQLIEPLWFALGRDERRELATGPAQAAVDLLDGTLAPPAGRGPGEAHAVIRGLFWLCRNLVGSGAGADPSAIALLVDDVHVSDSASLRFFAYLAHRLGELPLCLILTARAKHPTVDADALAAIRAHRSTFSLEPRAIGAAGVRELVTRYLPGAPAAFAEACATVTGGNPFLVIELLKQARARGVALDRVTAAELAALTPESVLRSTTARLSALTPQARSIARAVAMLGDGSSLQRAAAMAELDLTEAIRAADALSAADLLSPGLPLGFVHPLTRCVVLASIPPVDRAEGHRRAADILRAEGAAENAVRLLQRAVAEQPEGTVDAELMSELAQAQASAAGTPQAVKRLEHDLRVTQETPNRRVVALAEGRSLLSSRRHREAADVLAAARSDIPQDGELVDELEGTYLAAAFAVPELAADARRRAQQVRSAVGEHPTPPQREMFASLAMYSAMRGEPRAEVLELANLAWDDGALLELPGAWKRSAMHLTSALLFVDELERDLEVCQIAMARQDPEPPSTAFAAASYLRAWPRYEQGLLNDAAQDAQAGLESGADRWEVLARSAYAAIARIHIQRGQLDDAATALSILHHGDLADTFNVPFLFDARSQLHLATRQPAEALADAMEAGRQLEAGFGEISPGVVPWRSSAALAHLALGESGRAHELAEEELAMARRGDVTRVIVRDLRIQGLAARGKKSLALLEEAVHIAESHPQRLEYIHALIDLGGALRRSNRRAAARKPLDRALELTRHGGLTVLEQVAVTELATLGARARRSTLTGIDALTPSQRRVAELAAHGLTTRLIAEQLYVTPKTIEFHLRQIYQKLDVRTRAELTKLLAAESARDD